MQDNRLILIHLRELAALQADSVKSFRLLFNRLQESEVKDWVRNAQTISAEMLGQLNELIVSHGGNVVSRGTLKGAINHLWMEAKAKIAKPAVQDLWNNVELCEGINERRYRQVLAEKLPHHILSLLSRQHQMIMKRLLELQVLNDKKN